MRYKFSLTFSAIIFSVFMLESMFLTVPTAATLQHLQTGMEAPDFLLKDIGGQKKNFLHIKADKLTALVFWATWSDRSGKALSRMEDLYQRYRDKGFSVVGINVEGQSITEENIVSIRKMVDGLRLTFPVLIDSGLATFHSYGVIAVPTTVILDKDRIIRYELSGYPLVGSEDMVDFIIASIEGKRPADVIARKTEHLPDKKAIQYLNIAREMEKKMGMSDMAEVWLKKSIEADPSFVTPYNLLGRFYRDRGDLNLAVEQFQKALVREPDNVIALSELGNIFVKQGKVGEGRVLLEKAINKEPTYTPAYYYLGVALAREGRIGDAKVRFEEALKINPMDYQIYLHRAEVYEEKKMLKEALEDYRKAVELILR